jgi:hypothetical protein
MSRFGLVMVLVVSGVSVCCETPELRIGYLEELGGVERLGRDRANPLTGVAFWDGHHVSGPPAIEVNLRTQQARFFKGDVLVGVSPVSSGTEARRTPAGSYRILEKDIDHVSTLYGAIVEVATGRVVNDDATPKTPVPPGCRYEPSPMYHFMRLTWDGVGMHEGFLPGYPASHGCIRMDKDMVRHFYEG